MIGLGQNQNIWGDIPKLELNKKYITMNHWRVHMCRTEYILKETLRLQEELKYQKSEGNPPLKPAHVKLMEYFNNNDCSIVLPGREYTVLDIKEHFHEFGHTIVKIRTRPSPSFWENGAKITIKVDNEYWTVKEALICR